MIVHSVSSSTTTSDAKATAKRERILRAAVEVFAKNGFFASRVSEVAKEAGVADGTIYLYFASKEDLLVSIFREKVHQHLDALRATLLEASTPEERIRLAISHHLKALGADRPLAIVFQVELRQSLKFMSFLTREEVAVYLSILKELVEDGQRVGKFRNEFHPQLIANSIFGIVDELVTSWVLSEKEYVLSDQATEISDFVLYGLTSEAGS